jgi:dUTPase
MVVCPIIQAKLEDVKELSETTRGSDGFGSTGIK